MIWLTWRQHRVEAAIVFGALALLAAILIATGLDMRSAYDHLGIASCLSATNHDPTCPDAVEGFREQYGQWVSASAWLNLIPALLGILVGAPLVARELEHGTQRLVWTQSVTRWRWLAVKLAFVFVGCLAVAGTLWLLLAWWRQPWDTLSGRFGGAAFDFEGPVLLGFVAFALALGIASGAVLRRTVPAMVLMLALFLVVRLPVELQLRPIYQPPLTVTSNVLAGNPVTRADWMVDQQFIDAQGHLLDFRQVWSICGGQGVATKLDFLQCAHDHQFQSWTEYQPASRYWTFQAIETALYAVLALALLGLSGWWVRRRLS
ncbi:MAG TPA: ABC transporter permease subunit [Ktedonobacterales bacterium]|nr:ABC transporter permease subunit [Ktedonobacterales bacterium]